MEYEVAATHAPIIFGATDQAEIEQNIRTLLTTPQGSVPLDRNFGIDMTALDEPQPVAEARLTNRIRSSIRQYEPRAIVLGIRYERDAENGRLMPVIRYRIAEGEE